MIEIVCPSCGAQYQVPDDSIGPEGRKVTCSNCSHKWRAYREAAGAETAAPAAAGEAGGSQEGRPAEAAAAAGDSRTAETAYEETPDATAGDEARPASPAEMPPAQPPRAGGREEQMDAIRRMLDDLKRNSEDDPEPAPEPEARKQTARPEPSPRRYDDELDEGDVDPLKSRIAQMDKSGKAAGRPSNYDAAKLRRMHEKRARRLQKAKERQRKSGAFVTGFTLVGVVTAAMVMLYVMHPQIVASQPELEPAMNEYVVTVDRYRLALDETTAGWRAWIEENVEPLLGGEEQTQDGEEAQTGGQAQTGGASTASQ